MEYSKTRLDPVELEVGSGFYCPSIKNFPSSMPLDAFKYYANQYSQLFRIHY